jgi:hypothetical protein
MIKCAECGKKCRGDEIHYHKDAEGPVCEECLELLKEVEAVLDGTMGHRPVGG